MKKFTQIVAGIVFCICFVMQSISPAYAAGAELPGGEPRTFRVSAYYSPEAGQSRYLRGNYEAEIRLNGRGTNGADGTEVYPGMLAAPRNYPFGTQIYLPGLGMGTVHDRGGAIVPAGMRGQAHDRIDVWMGRGETGLARALAWGMRTVQGMVYWTGGAENSLSFLSVVPADISHLPLFASTPAPIAKGASGVTVFALQKQLAELGFYAGAISGSFDEATAAAVLAFQLDKQVIGSADTEGAGKYGPRTRGTLAQVVESQTLEKRAISKHLVADLKSGLERDAQGTAVAALQTRLGQLGYALSASGLYGPVTEAAVQQFQLDFKVTTEASAGFGVYGPRTHATLTNLLAERQYALVKQKPSIIVAKEFPGEKPSPVAAPVPEKVEPPRERAIIVREFKGTVAPPVPAKAVAAASSAERGMLVAEFE